MVAMPIAQWRTMTGIRRTQDDPPDDNGDIVVRVVLEAFHKIAGGEVIRVDFTVTDGNGSQVYQVSARDLWAPDDTDLTDPLPGWSGPGPAPIWGFGYTVVMTNQAYGEITVSATVVVSSPAANYTLPTSIKIYNHTDGTSLPPSTKEIYCSPSGHDTNNNGLSTTYPVRSIQKACELACTSNDAAGAKILLMAGTHQWARGGQGAPGGSAPWMKTSGDYWLTIERAPGTAFDEVQVTREDGSTSVWLNLNNPPSGTAHVRLRIRDLTIVGMGLAIQRGNSVTVDVWLDGCEEYSPFNSSIHIGAYDTDSPPVSGSPSLLHTYVTGGTKHHVINGWHGWDMVRGCRITDWIGVALQCTGNNQGVCNFYVGTQRYKTGVDGWFEVTTGPFEIEVPQLGRIRVKARNSSVPDFEPAALQLVELTRIKIRVSGDTNNTDNNGDFFVKGAGYSGGLPYVDLENGNPSPGQSSPNNLTIQIVNVNGDPYTSFIHPDVLQVNTDPTNYMLTNVRVFDLDAAQGFYAGTRMMTRCAFVNIAGGKNGLDSGFGGTNTGDGVDHVLMRHITWGGTWLFECDSNFSYTDFEVYDCAFRKAGYTAGSSPPPTTQVTNNHFEDVGGISGGVAFGGNQTTSTSGSFWVNLNYATSGDYSAYSSGPGSGSASGAWTLPGPYTASPADRGSWSNVNVDGGW